MSFIRSFSDKHLTFQLPLLGLPQYLTLTHQHSTLSKFPSIWCYQDWNHPSWQENFSGTFTSVVILLSPPSPFPSPRDPSLPSRSPVHCQLFPLCLSTHSLSETVCSDHCYSICCAKSLSHRFLHYLPPELQFPSDVCLLQFSIYPEYSKLLFQISTQTCPSLRSMLFTKTCFRNTWCTDTNFPCDRIYQSISLLIWREWIFSFHKGS